MPEKIGGNDEVEIFEGIWHVPFIDVYNKSSKDRLSCSQAICLGWWFTVLDMTVCPVYDRNRF